MIQATTKTTGREILSHYLTTHPANVHSYYAVDAYRNFTPYHKASENDLKTLLSQELKVAELLSV